MTEKTQTVRKEVKRAAELEDQARAVQEGHKALSLKGMLWPPRHNIYSKALVSREMGTLAIRGIMLSVPITRRLIFFG